MVIISNRPRFEIVGITQQFMDDFENGAETLLTVKCADCDHTQGHHIDTSKGKMILRGCSQCDCKKFKVRIKDKMKGFFSSKK